MQHTPALIPAIIVLCLFLVSGILSLGAAIANWEWFFNSKNCRIFTSRLSRRQARWLYGLLGALILLMTAVIARDLLQKAKPHEPPTTVNRGRHCRSPRLQHGYKRLGQHDIRHPQRPGKERGYFTILKSGNATPDAGDVEA